MIQHQAFFEALGSMDEKSAEWKSVLAGLSVLRLVDRKLGKTDPVDITAADTQASRAAVDAVGTGIPARAILSRILDHIHQPDRFSTELGVDLISYGRALDLEGRWPLAADVFDTVGRLFPESTHARTVIEASTLLGAAARSSGDWNTSTRAYTRAEHLASRIGDRTLFLTAQVGLANSQIIRGNLPAAGQELDQVIKSAMEEELEPVLQVALHARASVFHYQHDYQKAIQLAYRSMEMTTNPSARERLLADIAAAYAELGMRDVARKAYSIVAMTSPHQWVRWQSTLNIMELTIQEGDEAGYDELCRQMEGAALDPRLQTYFLFFRALGSQRFDRPDTQSRFDAAQYYAESNKLNQLAFEIENARSKIPVAPASATPSDELLEIAEKIEHLRDRSGIEPG
jgi:tetratricopeptide (TPR) repeat protein